MTDPVTLLKAICDTLVPSLRGDTGSAAVDELLAAGAVHDGTADIIPSVVAGLAPHARDLVEVALATLAADFVALDAPAREERWKQLVEDPETRPGAFILQSTILSVFYTSPDADGSNPTWAGIGYPGPLLPPPGEEEFPKTLATVAVPVGDGPIELVTDVVVVGSGAGGGPAAARLAGAGLEVIVVEKGSYRNEPDLPQLEALAFPNLYLGGGYLWSSDARMALLAGSTVGGGTTVNSMASLPTPSYVLEEWRAAGMRDADDLSFGAHIATVMERINARTENTVDNAVGAILNRGLDALGIAREVIPRNAKDDDTRFCGECNAGCLLGCKQSTMKTFLQDASDAGALLLADTTITRVVTAAGRAVGVEGTLLVDGSPRQVTVRAQTVVLAAGALMTPLILEASGIGGPAVGENLHVHASYFMSGVFDEVVNPWEGQILTSVSYDFDDVVEHHGFMVESAPMGIGFWSGLTPWAGARQHKAEMLRFRHVSGVWGWKRDHGAGSVRAGADGMPVVHWGLDDATDLAVVRDCHVQLARILHAAGAREIYTFLPSDPRWRQGEDFEAFLERLRGLSAEQIFSLSAHQSGSAATGRDPATSVVDGEGRLHDVEGVYVVDASALPTAPGVNPMVSIEAFAHKTAGHIVEHLRTA
ncbi:GMC family oxidoreductase N-terminal domain-containing protein [Nocardioides sp.]|uniref:GMC family oxidoreductase N-terminal domain-containing protein n=1 Tax=Nocardioides sp. TaxID=35761 RepID=UPI0039E3663A